MFRKRATCYHDVITDRYVCDSHRVWRDYPRSRTALTARNIFRADGTLPRPYVTSDVTGWIIA